MIKTFFNISEQKQNIINFIKKHKNILCLDYGSKAITAKFIDKLAKSNNNEFFRLAQKVQLKFGSKYFIFSNDCDEKHRMIVIWLPNVLRNVESDTAIEIACSINSVEDVIETRCTWFNMTPTCWKMFEALFDFYEEVVFQEDC